MQTLKRYTPCDIDGICPYMQGDGQVNCEWWCSAEEPEDYPWEYEEEDKPF